MKIEAPKNFPSTLRPLSAPNDYFQYFLPQPQPPPDLLCTHHLLLIRIDPNFSNLHFLGGKRAATGGARHCLLRSLIFTVSQRDRIHGTVRSCKAASFADDLDS